MRVKSLRLILIFAVALAAGNLIAQQTATTRVVIAVSDPSGAVVPGASIRVVPPADPDSQMETDINGKLALYLKPGGYALFVQSQGFAPVDTHFDVLGTRETQTITAVLHVAHGGGVVTEKDTLTLLASPYHIPMAISGADLKAMPHTTVTFHNAHTNADETYSGVRLAALLAKMNAPLGNDLRGKALANYVVATGSDGYKSVLALGEVDPAFHPGEVLVADAMDGKPLDEHSGPFKLVVTEDKRPARSVRNLVSIELKQAN